jgi:MATE family multidrug resistance protein
MQDEITNKNNNDLSVTHDRAETWREELSILGKMCVPMVASQLALIAINTTDVILMGWLGAEQLAAGALGMQFYLPVFLFAMGIILAVATITAQALGAGDTDKLRYSIRQGFWVATFTAIPLSILLWYNNYFLLRLGQDPQITILTDGYLRTAMWGLLPALLLMIMRSFMTAHSNIAPILIITVCGVLVNIIADYALMFGHFGFPRMELIGAGIASAIVQVGMCIAMMLYIARHNVYKEYELFRRFWRSNWPLFFEIFRIGLPIGLTILAASGFFSVATIMVGTLGVIPLAAHAIAQQITVVVFMVPLAISHAATIRVALSAGANDAVGIRRAGWTSIVLGMAIMVGISLIILILRKYMVMGFVDASLERNLPVLELANSLMFLAIIFVLLDGLVILSQGPLRGLKETRVPMIMAIIGYWIIGFACAIYMGIALDWGVTGIWVGMITGTAFVALMNTWRFIRVS